MDINVDQLRAIFEPFDLPHLLRLYMALTLFILIWGSIVTASGIYPTARRFWTVHLILLGSVYALSGICFLLLNIDPLLLLIFLGFISFVVQGHRGSTQDGPEEDWWAFRFYRRLNRTQKEPEEQK